VVWFGVIEGSHFHSVRCMTLADRAGRLKESAKLRSGAVRFCIPTPQSVISHWVMRVIPLH